MEELKRNDFTIVLPVHNGGQHFKECVHSILNQSYRHFDFLVLDNASSDGTLEWIRSIKDERIKVFPSEKFLSIEENWDRIKTMPLNEFATLIGHDDILGEDFLAIVRKLIEEHPEAALYQTHFDFIDADGRFIRSCKKMQQTLAPEQFVTQALQLEMDISGTGFVFRSDHYKSIGGIPLFPKLLYADYALWFAMVEYGHVAVSGKSAFKFRLHENTSQKTDAVVYMQAFEKFSEFLALFVKSSSKEIRLAVGNHFLNMLEYYRRSLSNKLLRVPDDNRKGLRVQDLNVELNRCAEMVLGHPVNGKKFWDTRIALWIDSFSFTRYIFRKLNSTLTSFNLTK